MKQFLNPASSRSYRLPDSAAVRVTDVREADARLRQERLLDEGLMETFPASDPVAIVRLT